jgi:predicted nucleic acid-binding protein
VSSLLLYPETRAALARAQRARRAGSRGIATARERIEALWASIDRVEVTESLAVRAGELADGHGLRGYDAVHLASLEHVGDTDVVLVTADRDLVEAARSIGFATIPVP